MQRLLLAVLLPVLLSVCSKQPETASASSNQTSEIERTPVEAWRNRAIIKRDLIARYGHSRYLGLVASQIMQESNWRANATSHVGAYGCGQFMPATQGDAKYWAKDLGVIDWGNCQQNVRASIRYMRALFKRIPESQGSDDWRYIEAIADYNRGMGWGDKERRLGFCVRNDRSCEETETYIVKIITVWQDYFMNMGYSNTKVVI